MNGYFFSIADKIGLSSSLSSPAKDEQWQHSEGKLSQQFFICCRHWESLLRVTEQHKSLPYKDVKHNGVGEWMKGWRASKLDIKGRLNYKPN